MGEDQMCYTTNNLLWYPLLVTKYDCKYLWWPPLLISNNGKYLLSSRQYCQPYPKGVNYLWYKQTHKSPDNILISLVSAMALPNQDIYKNMQHISSSQIETCSKSVFCKGRISRINLRNGYNMWSSSELVTAHGL